MHSDTVEASPSQAQVVSKAMDNETLFVILSALCLLVGAFFGWFVTYFIMGWQIDDLHREVYMISLGDKEFHEAKQHEALETGFPQEGILFQSCGKINYGSPPSYRIVLRREDVAGRLIQEEMYPLHDADYGDIDLEPAFGIPVTLHIVEITNFYDGSGKDRLRYGVTVRKE